MGNMPMFHSILVPESVPAQQVRYQEHMPKCFNDLNLDKIVEDVCECVADKSIAVFFYTALHDRHHIIYRQQVMKDLEDFDVSRDLSHCANSILSVNEQVGKIVKQVSRNKNSEPEHLDGQYFLLAAMEYDALVDELISILSSARIASDGLLAFNNWLVSYRDDSAYLKFRHEMKQLANEMEGINYCLHIKEDKISVQPFDGESDYHEAISRLFDRFSSIDVKKSYQQEIIHKKAQHIEYAIYELLSKTYPSTFDALIKFYKNYISVINDVILKFAHEIKFYIAWLAYISPFIKQGLPFCYPGIDERSEHIYCLDNFDIGLAKKLRAQNLRPVTNSFEIEKPERVVVVTGPNQGGKTTFSRAFGQFFYLASLGCPVPGERAKTVLFDNIFTHYNHTEDDLGISGKLQDDLHRLRDILDAATEKSIFIVNEIYSSATHADARDLGMDMIENIISLGAVGLCVTFIDELANYRPYVVSMSSTVDEMDPSIRTFKVIRKPSDGNVYIVHLAKKYNLTYEQLCERLSI